jgi:hypothetical protein
MADVIRAWRVAKYNPHQDHEYIVQDIGSCITVTEIEEGITMAFIKGLTKHRAMQCALAGFVNLKSGQAEQIGNILKLYPFPY